MATTSFDPFRDLDRWLSNGMVRTPASVGMPLDLYRKGESFIARIDLPGVDPSTIDVDVEDRTLTVRAERPSGTFARQLTLGYGLALDRISAQYTDGVLTLTIPVAEEAKPRKIEVTHASSSHPVIENEKGQA